MNSLRKLTVLLVFLIFITGAAYGTLSTPSEVKVKSEEGFFSNYNGSVIGFELTANDFKSTEVHYSSENISREIEGRVKNNFTLKIRNTESIAHYSFAKDDLDPVRTIDFIKTSYDWGQITSLPETKERYSKYENIAEENCRDLNKDGSIHYYVNEENYGWFQEKVKGNLYCAKFGDIKSQITPITSTPEEIQTTTFSINNEIFTLSNSQIGKGKTYQGNNTLIRFKGSYETGYNFPEPDNEYVAYSNSKGFWLIHKSQYESDYKDYLNTAEIKHVNDLGSQQKTEAKLEELSRLQVQEVLKNYSKSEFYTQNTTIKNGQLELTGNRKSGFPSFQVWIKANQLQYYIPQATPKIQYIDQKITVDEAQKDHINLRVRNNGTGKGSFTAKILSCSKNFSAPDTSQSTTLKPSETQELQLGVTFSSNNTENRKINGECQVQVKNLNNPQEKVIETVSTTGIQSPECKGKTAEQINQKLVHKYSKLNSEDKGKYAILECTENQLQRKITTVCSKDQRVNNQYQCTNKESASQEAKIDTETAEQENTGSNNCLLLDYSMPLNQNITVQNPVCQTNTNTLLILTIVLGAVIGKTLIKRQTKK